MTAHSVNDAREKTLRAERDEALAEVERLRTRATICRRCGDTITPGTMNARGVLHTADGVECGVCVGTSGDAEPNADAMTPDAERSFRLYAAGLDMSGGTIRRVGQVIARDLLAEIDRLRGVFRAAEAERDRLRVEVLAYVAEADEQIRLRDEARAQLAALRQAADASFEWLLQLPWDPQQIVEASRARDRLRTVLADVMAAAEAHDRRVRAEALREAADAVEARGEATRHPWMLGSSAHNPSGTVLTESGAARCDEARWLRARADEIERGER